MRRAALNGATPPAAAGLVPGTSFFQVLEPVALLGPNGEQNYSMVGPFGDLLNANAYSASRPGSLITVTLVLFQTPAATAPAVAVPPPDLQQKG